MIEHKIDSIVGGQIKALKTEIASRDYQIIKSIRAGVDVDVMYPGHRAWYQMTMEKIQMLEDTQKVQDEANAHLATLPKP
jgi:hypothetical protein